MSDEFEHRVRETAHHLLVTYQLIIQVCELLPVPITLPNSEVIESREIIPAVARVVEIIEDQPITEIQQAGIWGACLHWLAGANLFTQLLATPADPTLDLQIQINVVVAGEALVLISQELRHQE
ncbi:hypothetical protein [Streptomyces sp. x-80]|uniref:hypothetical protein n=1 Tax=Streptomyces sp. x-80 TaxID=2789282 RepID=UPI00397F67DA